MPQAGSSSCSAAGGDRDPGKRPLMGAHRRATSPTSSIVTDDNPRSEDAGRDPPRDPRRRPAARSRSATARRASRAAIGELRPGDVLVIAGKGHETGQIVGGETLPFDDAEIAAESRATPPGLRTGGWPR